jgi:hypothetical protein
MLSRRHVVGLAAIAARSLLISRARLRLAGKTGEDRGAVHAGRLD